jgi:hypothetical protein
MLKYPRRVVLKVVVSSIAVVSSMAVDSPSIAASSFTASSKKTVTTKAKATAKAKAKAKAKKPTALDLRKKAVLELYAKQKDLQFRYLTNKTTESLVPREGQSVWTGLLLEARLKDEASYQTNGMFVDIKGPSNYEALNLRIESISQTNAIVRVCERVTGFRLRKSNGSRVDPTEDEQFVTDLTLTMVYSPKLKRWLNSLAQFNEPQEGKSTCADK